MLNRVFIDDAAWAWLEDHPEFQRGWLHRFLDAPSADDRRLPMYATPVYETTVRITSTAKIIVKYAITSEWSNTPTLRLTQIRGPFPG